MCADTTETDLHCCSCGTSFGPEHATIVQTQRIWFNDTQNDNITLRVMAGSRYCSMRAMVASTSALWHSTPAALALLADECEAVRALAVSNDSIKFYDSLIGLPGMVEDHSVTVRMALWRRTDLPVDLRERLDMEFATSGASAHG